MKPTSSQKQTRQIYLSAVLLGLLAGGFMIFYQKPPEPEGPCAATSANLGPFAKGEVAAFISPAAPRMLPNISFHDTDGKLHSLKDFSGKTVLLNLWATWCVPCREEMPTLGGLQQKRGGQDFAVVALSLDAGGIEKPKKFFTDIKIKTLPLYHDEGAVFQSMRKAALVTGLPTSFLIDKEGCLLGTLAGPANWVSDEALKLIDAAKN